MGHPFLLSQTKYVVQVLKKGVRLQPLSASQASKERTLARTEPSSNSSSSKERTLAQTEPSSNSSSLTERPLA